MYNPNDPNDRQRQQQYQVGPNGQNVQGMMGMPPQPPPQQGGLYVPQGGPYGQQQGGPYVQQQGGPYVQQGAPYVQQGVGGGPQGHPVEGGYHQRPSSAGMMMQPPPPQPVMQQPMMQQPHGAQGGSFQPMQNSFFQGGGYSTNQAQGQGMDQQQAQQHGAPGQGSGFPNFLGMSNEAQNFTQQMFTQVVASQFPTGQRFFSENSKQVREFFKLPKSYFAVNNRYVLKKLFLILCPFMNKSWQRRRGVDSGNFEGVDPNFGQSIPREDINAPDLYIPVMALVTYVLCVGFISGTKGVFTPDKMGTTASMAIGVVTFEVLLVRLGFYLINARSAPWVDFVAFRGYKFVGLVLSLLVGAIVKQLYYPTLFYCASMMALFLMRTYLRILLPTDQSGVGLPQSEVTKRNYFLLFIALLQYPLYWILSVKP